MLTFIGACSAVVAGGGWLPPNLALLILVTLALGSAGVNGLTNYLDREVDARMMRTCGRALPSRRIHPPQKALPLIIALTVAALALAWLLHPLCFLSGLVGTIAAVIFRKTGFTHLLGAVSGCAPVLIGWLAVDPRLEFPLLYLCILVAVWIPLHVWSVMLAHRDDYLKAGVNVFPLTWQISNALMALLILSFLLYAASLVLYFGAGFGLLYLVMANLLGVLMIYATFRLLITCGGSEKAPMEPPRFFQSAWRVYKLSSFPYLGLIFLAMCLDLWLL